MKKIIRLTEGDLHRIIENTVRRVLKEGTLNEYVSMKHSGHNLDDYLDDKDFIEIVNRVVGMYDAEEFEEDGEMVFSEIDYHKSMMVEGLPLHEEENIKINYIQ